MVTNKMARTVVVGLLGMWASQALANFVSYQDRGAWEQAVGIFYDVNLNDGTYNTFDNNTVLDGNDCIYLPPDNLDTLTFNQSADVRRDNRFHDYFPSGPSSLGGLVLQFGAGTIEGRFSSMASSGNNFGFEFLPTAENQGQIEINVFDSNNNVENIVFLHGQLSFSDSQFIGWVSDVPVSYFSITSSGGGVYVGNFVVPDAGMTIGLLGCSLLVLSSLLRWIS